MKNPDSVSVHDREADQYDRLVSAFNNHGHDVLFGISAEYVNPGECLLDLGIGTGLASITFAKLGVNVFGCDGSAEMLKICKSKMFAKDLKAHDLQDIPLPYSSFFFDHVICCGVLHFFDDLEAIVKEVLRIKKTGGIFAFTTAVQTSAEEAANKNRPQDYLETPTPWGVSIFKHSSGYLNRVLHANDFEILKTQQFVMRSPPEDKSEELFFNAIVTRIKGVG